MLFSGNNFRVTPETNQMGFVFSGLSINGTGIAEIGFSGQGNVLKFLFRNNRIFSPDGKFVAVYNTGEPITVNGYIDTGSYQYFFDSNGIANRKTKSNFLIQRFFVNTTGSNLLSDVKLFCPNIETRISAQSSFNALTSLTGYISNNSAINYKVFNSSLTYNQSNSDALLGQVSGVVTGNSTGLAFSFSDGNTSRFDSSIRFILSLDTSIGPISGSFLANRVSGLDYVIRKLSTSSTGINISGLFDGSGRIPNKFVFTPSPLSTFLNYYSSVSNLRGAQQEKSFQIQIENLSHSDGQTYEASYVTGFTLVSSGEYLEIPSAKFTGYYFVTGLNWNLSTIILSSGCTGNVPILFSGLGGVGASGVLLSNRTFLSGVYGDSVQPYYLPYEFSMVSGGTGYLLTASGILRTGIYPNCYDVARASGSSSIYVPFSGSGLLAAKAAYLTGEVLFRTGLVSGGQLTGYIVTGLEITNPGSGYSSIYIPRMSFIRQAGDNLISGATGSFSMKSTGLYSLTGNWSVRTGVSNGNLLEMSGLSGTLSLASNQNYFTVQVNFSGTDHTEPIATKVTVSMVNGSSIIQNISGMKYYDTSTGFLKKKNELGTTKYVADSLLSFSLTQNELDNYYSSNEYLNEEPVDFGDLDF